MLAADCLKKNFRALADRPYGRTWRQRAEGFLEAAEPNPILNSQSSINIERLVLWMTCTVRLWVSL